MVGFNSTDVIAFIALGANLAADDTRLSASLTQASDRLGQDLMVLSKSRIFRTPCFPAGAGPDYLNAVISVEWVGESHDLLANLHNVEQEFGRVRGTRWAARSLDLDLVGHGQRMSPDLQTVQSWINLPLADQMTTTPDQLILPHPRIQNRAFVLGPMMDIAPDWVHPVLGLTVQQMWDALPVTDRAAIQAV